jgi:hypothetical protein
MNSWAPSHNSETLLTRHGVARLDTLLLRDTDHALVINTLLVSFYSNYRIIKLSGQVTVPMHS